MILTFFRWVFGYKYILNQRTGEVHDKRVNHVNCHLDIIKDKRYLTEKEFLKGYKNKDYNGCRWCMKEYDNG